MKDSPLPLRRGQWTRLRDGKLLKAEHLPGDCWPGWFNPVPEGVFGGTCREGSSGWASTQSARLKNVVGVYDDYGDARGWPKARGAMVVEA